MEAAPGTLQHSEDLAREIETGWQLLVKGYGQLRHAVVDVGGSQNQVAILTGLMRYTKLLVTSMLVHVADYRVINRSEIKELGLTLDTELKPVAVPAERKEGPPREAMQINGNALAMEHAMLRESVGVLAEELIRELEKGVGGVQQELLNAMATKSRRDTELSYALQQHIAENRFHPMPEEAGRKAVGDLTAMNVALKERSDRLKADNMKLSADKFALLADKTLLAQRVQTLEATLADRNASLSKYRNLAARARGLRGTTPRPPSASSSYRHTPLHAHGRGGGGGGSAGKRTVTVGGVEMEPEVVQWLKEVYQSLGEEAPEEAARQESLAGTSDFHDAMGRR